MTALLSAAASSVTVSRRLVGASEALRCNLPGLAGRLSASGLFGRVAVEPSLGFLQPPARRSARELAVQAAHRVRPSVLTVRGNRASLAGNVATSADLPNLAGTEV